MAKVKNFSEDSMFKKFSIPKGVIFLIFAVLSFLAGGINGFLGTGGGVLFIYTLLSFSVRAERV